MKTSDLVAAIKERGYLEFTARPSPYMKRRVPTVLRLEEIVARYQVSLRGWDFPHLSQRTPIVRENTSIYQRTDWEHHREVWRFFQSGQLLYIGGMGYEWRDRSGIWPPDKAWAPNEIVPFFDLIWSIAEFVEFTARLANSEASSEDVELSLTVGNTKGRQLVALDPARSLAGDYRCQISSIEVSRSLSKADLTLKRRELADAIATEALEKFGFDPVRGVIRDIQGELLDRDADAG